MAKMKSRSVDKAHDAFIQMMKDVNSRVLQMQDVVRGIMLAILSGRRLLNGKLVGEHLFMIGAPGIGKSYVMDMVRLCLDIPDKHFFDELFNPFSSLSDFVGDVDTEEFMKNYRYRRNLEWTLATAFFAILDEIWKAGPVTSCLLKITNERKFKNRDDGMVDCPLITSLSASNEYPANPNDALWDRLLFRYFVTPLQGRDNWKKLDDLSRKPFNPSKVSLDTIYTAKEEVLNVEIGDDVTDTIYECHENLDKAGIMLSTRRKKAMWNVVRAEAWLSGRHEARPEDVMAIWPCCWRHDREIPNVRKIIAKVANASFERLVSIFDECNKLYETLTSLVTRFKSGDSVAAELVGQYEVIDKKYEALRVEANSDSVNKTEAEKMASQVRVWVKEIHPYVIRAEELK